VDEDKDTCIAQIAEEIDRKSEDIKDLKVTMHSLSATKREPEAEDDLESLESLPESLSTHPEVVQLPAAIGDLFETGR
jgi:hypothetical protein